MAKCSKPRAVSWCLPKEEFESDLKSLKEDKLNGFGFESEPFYDAQQFIRSLAFHPDGSTLCIGSGQGQIEVFDDLNIHEEETLFPKFVGKQHHQRSVLDVTFSPDGSCLASCSNDKTIQLIDYRSLSCRYRAAYYHNIEVEPEHTLEHEHSVRCIHFPTCLQLLSGESGECELKLWDLIKHKVTASWSEHVGAITGIQCDDSLMVTAGIDKKIVIWDARKTEPIQIINRYPSRINDIKLIKKHSDHFVIAAHDDSAVICYSLARGCVVWQAVTHNTSCNSISISSDDKLCLSSSLNGQIAVHDTETGKLLSNLYQQNGAVTAKWNSKSAQFAAANNKGVINLWSTVL